MRMARGEPSMATDRFTEEEITARARKLADERGPGWATVTAGERVGKDSAEFRYWRELAVKELEGEDKTTLDVEADTPKTVGLD